MFNSKERQDSKYYIYLVLVGGGDMKLQHLDVITTMRQKRAETATRLQ